MQVLLTVSVPTLTVLIGILVNNSRLTDLRGHMDSRFADINTRFTDINTRFTDLNTRFADLKETMNARFDASKAELLRVEQVMDARLKHLEEKVH